MIQVTTQSPAEQIAVKPSRANPRDKIGNGPPRPIKGDEEGAVVWKRPTPELFAAANVKIEPLVRSRKALSPPSPSTLESNAAVVEASTVLAQASTPVVESLSDVADRSAWTITSSPGRSTADPFAGPSTSTPAAAVYALPAPPGPPIVASEPIDLDAAPAPAPEIRSVVPLDTSTQLRLVRVRSRLMRAG